MTGDLASAPALLALALAFVGGLVTFLSPCVLPLVPAYLGRLAGVSLAADAAASRWLLARHALAFVIGFAAVFTVAGIAVGLLIEWLQVGLDVVRIAGGAAVILLGLHTAGWLTIPALYREARLDPAVVKRRSIGGSLALGMIFAAGWSPCIGTILTGIFALATTQTARAGLLFFVYSLGLGVPFLIAGLVFGRFAGVIRRVNEHARVVSAVSGLFLIGVGLLLLTNTFTLLAALGPPIEPFGG
jgi:cytochrome c-type biogenesis protein